MYSRVADVLSREQVNETSTFEVLYAYLRLFEDEKCEIDMAKEEARVRCCVLLAIKASSVINFEEIQDLRTIKTLQGSVSNLIPPARFCVVIWPLEEQRIT